MSLKTDMLADLDDVFFNTNEFAETVTYTPYGGTAGSIAAIPEDIDPSIMDVPPAGDSMLLTVKVSDVPNPLRGDTFLIGTETWHLVKNLGGGAYARIWSLVISRSGKRKI